MIRPRPLSNEMVEILKKYPIAFSKDQFVFKNPRTDTHYSTDVLRRIWNKAIKKAAVKINIHQGARHSFASQAVNRGVDINLISRALGHTNIKTTMRYAHVNTETLRQVQRPENKVRKLNFK